MHSDELLAAYVADDLLPQERKDIDQQLSVNPSLQSRLQELEELLTILKRGKQPVTVALMETLRQRVTQQIAILKQSTQFKVLMAASLSGDLNSEEQAVLQKHLVDNPGAQRDLAALRLFADLLKGAALPCGPELSEKLAERLKKALPGAGIGRQKGRAATVARRARSTALIFLASQKSWSRPVRWIAVSAAAVVVVGVGMSIFSTFLNPDAHNSKVVQTAPSHEIPVFEKIDPPDMSAGGVRDIASSSDEVPTSESFYPQKSPPDFEFSEHSGTLSERMVNGGSKVADLPVSPAQETPLNADANKLHGDISDRAPVSSQESSLSGNSDPEIPVLAEGANMSMPGTGIVSAGQSKATNVTADKSDPAASNVEPIANVAVVGAIRDGNVQARTSDGRLITLQPQQQIPSGTEIVTDRARVAIVLPGDGRLWINRNTSLVLTLRNQNTVLTLISGEISYRAPASSGAGLFLTSGDVQVNNAKGVDVKVQSNELIVQVMEKSANVGGKGKIISIGSGLKAVATLNGADAPRKEPFTGQPDSWRMDLVVPGERVGSDNKNITSETEPKVDGRRKYFRKP